MPGGGLGGPPFACRNTGLLAIGMHHNSALILVVLQTV